MAFLEPGHHPPDGIWIGVDLPEKPHLASTTTVSHRDRVSSLGYIQTNVTIRPEPQVVYF
jgi:hypothetical protein